MGEWASRIGTGFWIAIGVILAVMVGGLLSRVTSKVA